MIELPLFFTTLLGGVIPPVVGTRTFGGMKSRIARDMLRTDIPDAIGEAIIDAIRTAAMNRFWFNEVRGLTFNTVAGQAFYDAATLPDIATLVDIDAVWLVNYGQRRNIYSEPLQDMDYLLGGTPGTGEPYMFARQANGIRFYRIPDRAYPIYIDGVSRLSPLVNDSDTNAWMTEGERLIRAMAKSMLYNDIVGDSDLADREANVAEGIRRQLIGETETRTGADTMAAWA